MCCDMKFDYLYLIFITSNAVGHQIPCIFRISDSLFNPGDLSLHPWACVQFFPRSSVCNTSTLPEGIILSFVDWHWFSLLFFDSNSFFNMKLNNHSRLPGENAEFNVGRLELRS